MKFDLHLHTTRHSPDSHMGPLAMCRRALAIGLDGVVITEHDYQWEEGELSELSRIAAPVLVFSGDRDPGSHGASPRRCTKRCRMRS